MRPQRNILITNDDGIDADGLVRLVRMASEFGNVSDGYSYMMSLGYDDVARVCLTHSFNGKSIDGYIGHFDTTDEETALIKEKLAETASDDYDRLIRLCDSITGAGYVMDIIDRMTDVKTRYGSYDPEKWNTNL